MTTLTEKLAAERKAERAAVAREAAKREKAGQLIAAEEDRQRELATIGQRLEFLAPLVAEAAELEKRRKQLGA
jgi:hypothetical protein